ncbi:TspO/MBR family protein [Variovorax sp. HJSM1_2]|uniref:TspO/MBR family protein n=1 Tax=Variovorax sp. HJSM1_2 TaxID=3366263 RepID=UPI003BEB96B5
MAYSSTTHTRRTPTHQTMGLIAWLLASFVAGGIGAIASVNAQAFYGELIQPNWAPPAGLFGPVWTVLYAMMAVAAWLVWRSKGWRGAAPALTLFLMQLAANALWTWLFFAWHWGAAAMVEILLLWLLIAATAASFWRHHRLASLLLLPYLAWVSFAATLNFFMWQLNPSVLGS